MVAKALPSAEELNKLLKYDEKTGQLTWRRRDSSHFPKDRIGRTWNARWAGRSAFQSAHQKGYMCGGLLGKTCLAHRVIWKMVTGEEPDTIDHVNGIKSDNRWANLRSVSNAENHRNMPLQKNNTSGFPGVSLHRRDNVWTAMISVDGKPRYLGRYRCKTGAILARKRGEQEFAFHENHGR